MFIRNTWYVAARDCEITARPVPVTLLGDNIVLFRQDRGTVVALEDACVHRKLPLSMG
jgi:phenylpropionate dioxygenase-like ring-hydroxylating dioxygenase large terminal subunit